VVEGIKGVDGEVSARALKSALDNELVDSMKKGAKKSTEAAEKTRRVQEGAVVTAAKTDIENVRRYLTSFLSTVDSLAGRFEDDPTTVIRAVSPNMPRVMEHLERLPDALKFLRKLSKGVI
jgi:hypothetical protein